MSHELHLSKLMKRLIFSCFHFHHPQYLAGNTFQSKWLLGPHLQTIPTRAEVGEECCSSLGSAHPSWEHLGCLSRPARRYLLVFGWHSCLAVGLTWKRPHQLGVCLVGNKVLCATVARVSILSGPRGFPCFFDTLKHVRRWAILILRCVLHLCTDHASLGSARRDWPKRQSVDVLQHSPASLQAACRSCGCP